MDTKLLEVIVCPVSKTPLQFKSQENELWCIASGLAYPIDDGIPVLVPNKARTLNEDELKSD